MKELEEKIKREKGDVDLANLKRKKNDEKNEVFRYVGETSRSARERAGEHWKDLEFRRPKSHMLRHVVD